MQRKDNQGGGGGGSQMKKKELKGVVLLGTTESLPPGGHPVFKLPICVLQLMRSYLSEGFLQRAFSPATPYERRVELAGVTSGKNEMYVCKFFYTNFTWAGASDWSALMCPALVLSGADDQITTVEGARSLFAHYFATDKRSRMVVLESAGHQLMQEKPEACADAIKDFLSAILYRDNCLGIFFVQSS